ncbi:DUF2946 domain-containing protein [Siccibacter turicensis]|uniref:DUF2946 domain-containing protein n=1 Tax=Siccibacter turicensis TaxID=357233 RepID=UPI000465AD84|nr:DUF2946 domain-containing protein [Siccibacter turicensis]
MTPRKSTLKAARLALFAMLLIVFAPLVSITLQLASHSPVQMMHHDMPGMMMPEQHVHHEGMGHHATQQPTLSQQHQDALMLMEHAGACGYCVLLTHMPGLLTLAVVMLGGSLRLQRIAPVAPTLSIWLFIPWLYPHTRAPPRPSAFSLC